MIKLRFVKIISFFLAFRLEPAYAQTKPNQTTEKKRIGPLKDLPFLTLLFQKNKGQGMKGHREGTIRNIATPRGSSTTYPSVHPLSPDAIQTFIMFFFCIMYLNFVEKNVDFFWIYSDHCGRIFWRFIMRIF